MRHSAEPTVAESQKNERNKIMLQAIRHPLEHSFEQLIVASYLCQTASFYAVTSNNIKLIYTTIKDLKKLPVFLT